jgi:hypothetical protein
MVSWEHDAAVSAGEGFMKYVRGDWSQKMAWVAGMLD